MISRLEEGGVHKKCEEGGGGMEKRYHSISLLQSIEIG